MMFEDDMTCVAFTRWKFVILADLPNSQLYKELEIINFKELTKSLDSDKREKKSALTKIFNNTSKVTSIEIAWNKKPYSQIVLFQRSMKLLLLCGQFIGLNPVEGITETDITKMRFKYLSFRFLYSILLFLCQATAAILCIYRPFKHPTSINILAYISFYCAVSITTFHFLRMAMKWPALMREIADSCLDKYVDLSVESKCTRYTAALLSIAILEHVLSQCSNVSRSLACHQKNLTTYEIYLHSTFPWFAQIGIPFNIPLGICLQLVNVISTINWSYSDGFIVCMSFYLASLLNKINQTVHDADKRYYHPSFWSRVREDYTKATLLVASFDKAISGVILVSFASNLFFICLQMFYVLGTGLSDKPGNTNGQVSCQKGSEAYFVISFMFVLGRFLAVSFVAASVHTASLAPAPALYAVSSTAYCTEIQRFQEQIHGSNVALSGLQFFYVTKGLVLSVAGTVVTYELVLLQFSDED